MHHFCQKIDVDVSPTASDINALKICTYKTNWLMADYSVQVQNLSPIFLVPIFQLEKLYHVGPRYQTMPS